MIRPIHVTYKPVHAGGVAWCPIRKCASTSLVRWVSGHSYLERITRDYRAIVRDPVDRYLSSLAQMFKHTAGSGGTEVTQAYLASKDAWVQFLEPVRRFGSHGGEIWTNGRDRHFSHQHTVMAKVPSDATLTLYRFEQIEDLPRLSGFPQWGPLPFRNVFNQEHRAIALEILDVDAVRDFYLADYEFIERYT